MADVYGTVKRITNRGKAWNVQMDSGEWFGMGYQQPDFGEGSEIAFDVEYNGQYANVAKGSIEVINAVQQQQQQRPQQGGYQQRQGGGYQQRQGGGYQQRQGGAQGAPQRGGYQQRAQQGAGGGKDQYWKDKEKRDIDTQARIQLQACRNSALTLVQMGLANDCIPLPAKKADRLGALIAIVDEITLQYVGDVNAGGPACTQQDNNQQDDDMNDDLPDNF